MGAQTYDSRPVRFMRQFRDIVARLSYVNWALADQAIVSGTSFITTVLVARFLGIEEFGRFALVWLGVFFAQNLQIALIVAPMMTIGAKQAKADRSLYSGSVLVQQLLVGIATAAFVYAGCGVADVFLPHWRLWQVALPLSLLILLGQGADFLRRYFFTFQKAHFGFAVDAIRYGAQILCLLVLLLTMGGAAHTANVLYALSFAAFLGLAAGTVFFGPARFSRINFTQTLKRHWSFSRWLFPTVIANWCRENFVYTAVGVTLGLGEVGALRAGQQLVRMVNVPIQGFDNIVPMRAAAAYQKKDLAGLVDFVKRFVLTYNAAIAAALLVIGIFGGPLLGLLYGAEYAAHGYIVASYAAVMGLYLARNVLAMMLRTMERTIYEFYAAISAALLITFASFPMVRYFAIPGAMLSLALFEIIMIVWLFTGLRYQFRPGGEVRR